MLRLLFSAAMLGLLLCGCAERADRTPSAEGAESFVKLRGYEFNKEGFFSAAAARDIPAVNGFLSAGIDADVQDDSEGRTALITAAARGHLDIVQVLLAGGADANIKDKTGRTALFHALEARYDDVADVLVSHSRIDLNGRGKNGVTALIS